jgi:4-oxalocrotonate tautomerase
MLGRQGMPGVLLNVREGFGQQKAKTVIQGIARVCVDLDVPSGAVEFIVHEIQKSHWGIGGEPASEKLKDTSP